MKPRCKSCGIYATLKCSGCENTFYCGKSCQIQNFQTHQSLCGSQFMFIQGKRGRKTSNNVADAMAEIINVDDISLLIFQEYFFSKKEKTYALLSLEADRLPFFAFYDQFQQSIADYYFTREVPRPQYNAEMGPESDVDNTTSRTVKYFPGKRDTETIWEYMLRRKDILK